jgi:hypothetical protein
MHGGFETARHTHREQRQFGKYVHLIWYVIVGSIAGVIAKSVMHVPGAIESRSLDGTD